MNNSLEFRVLGQVEVLAGHRRVGLGHARRRSLLAVLLADPGRVALPDQLIERMWGGQPPASARNIVSGYVARLRDALGRATGEEPPLRSEMGGYLVDVDSEAVDLHRFRRLVTQARESSDEDSASALLAEALALPRGSAFDGLASPWLEHLAEVIGEELWNARLDHADLLLRRGRHTAILPELHAWADERPMDERLTRLLMTALYGCGQQAEAIMQFHRLRERLTDELGVDPGPRLCEFHQQILHNDPALNPALTAGGPQPPGGSAGASPATLASPAHAPAQLPPAISCFTGRATELDELRGLLPDPGYPIARGSVRLPDCRLA